MLKSLLAVGVLMGAFPIQKSYRLFKVEISFLFYLNYVCCFLLCLLLGTRGTMIFTQKRIQFVT